MKIIFVKGNAECCKHRFNKCGVNNGAAAGIQQSGMGFFVEVLLYGCYNLRNGIIAGIGNIYNTVLGIGF